MSEQFFEFSICCPKCGAVTQMADGFETDDWVEVFVFSGYSQYSAKYSYSPETICPTCGAKNNTDSLYRDGRIKVDICRIKKYLSRMLDYVIKHGGIGDHGWSPDLDAVLYRYSLLYPDDAELAQLKSEYYLAIHDKKSFTKLEPFVGTTCIDASYIKRKGVLEKVYLPFGLVCIMPETFKDCPNLKDIFIPDSVTEIGAHAFENSGIQTIHLSKSIKRINEYLFCGCWGVSKVFLADEIESIGKSAFEGCKSLIKPWLPSELKIIEERAFYGCTSIGDIFLPDKLTTIGKDAFSNCGDLVIHGKNNSFAEQYAKNNNIAFVKS